MSSLTLAAIDKSENVSPEALPNEALASYVAGTFTKIAEALPYIIELRKRFAEARRDGKQILDCDGWEDFCQRHLQRTPRAIQIAIRDTQAFTVICPFCNELFPSRGEFKKHQRKNHVDELAVAAAPHIAAKESRLLPKVVGVDPQNRGHGMAMSRLRLLGKELGLDEKIGSKDSCLCVGDFVGSEKEVREEIKRLAKVVPAIAAPIVNKVNPAEVSDEILTKIYRRIDHLLPLEESTYSEGADSPERSFPALMDSAIENIKPVFSLKYRAFGNVKNNVIQLEKTSEDLAALLEKVSKYLLESAKKIRNVSRSEGQIRPFTRS